MVKTDKIMVTGHTGMIGSAFMRLLKNKGYSRLITESSKVLDLRDQSSTERFIKKKRPDIISHFAGRVGGIKANAKYPAAFLYDNLAMQTNVIHAAFKYGVKKLLFLGSSCIYPRECPQPMKEEYLLTGPLEPTNEAYALAKIAGIKMCEFYRKQYNANFFSLIPANTYGVGDNFDLESSHVISALIRKFYEAVQKNKLQVEVWGSGTPVRDFIYVDDVAYACFYAMKNHRMLSKFAYLNVGTGRGTSIKEVAEIIKDVSGYRRTIVYDTSKKDGFPVKLLDVQKFSKSGWKPKMKLEDGLKKACKWFESQIGRERDVKNS